MHPVQEFHPMTDRTPSDSLDPALSRYSRQVLFPAIGAAGQNRLRLSQVALVGCGALGTVIASTLVRAGVGGLRIIDRDFIELNNLQRQVLFDEHDIAAQLPKAEAAARKLRKINSSVSVEAIVADLTPACAESLCGEADLILDGTDNFETRFLINDLAVKLGTPWVYGACVAAEGLILPIFPRQSPCLRCIWDDAPPPGMSDTCDTAGVLGPLVNIVASLQSMEAIKILSGNSAAVNRNLVSVDVWTGRVRSLDVSTSRPPAGCLCCGQRKFEFLDGARVAPTVVLCGRDAIQISPATDGARIDLKALASRLRGERAVANEFMLRFGADGLTFTVFPDGRSIIQGTSNPTVARAAHAKYVGA